MTTPWWGPPGAVSTCSLPSTANVVVVGAGIMGLATAYHLACAGARPLVLEREGLGAGATGRNGGFLPVGTAEDYDRSVARLGRADARELLLLTLENRRLAGQILEREAIACDFRPSGHLHLALTEAEQLDNRSLAALLSEDGCSTEVLDRTAAQALVGTPFSPRIAGGLFFHDIALLHPGMMCAGLAAAAIRHGARIVKADVRQIRRAGQGAQIETDGGTIAAGAALVAVNAWTGTLVSALSPFITPVRGQVVAYAPVAPLFRTGVTALTTATEEYWQQHSDGSILLGGCRALRPGGDEGVVGEIPTEDVQQALDRVLPSLFPQLGELRATHRWAGPMAFTPDRLPIVAHVSEHACWSVGGFSGHGMSLSFILAQLLSDTLLGRPADPRLGRFVPDRFTGGAG